MSLLRPDDLPYSVTVDGVEYGILPQYFIIIEIFALMEDDTLSDHVKARHMLDLFYADVVPPDARHALDAMWEFIRRGSWNNGYRGKESNERVIDWELDAPFIWASMKQAYPLWDWSKAHWWEWKAAFDALPATAKINEVLQIRTQKIDGKMEPRARDTLRELKRAYALPDKGAGDRRTAAEIEADLKASLGGKGHG